MLIFDSKKGRFGTQKQRQWGPLSAVRSAVFRNAEQLGIDPAWISGHWPLWEGAGSVGYDVINGNNATIGANTPFDKNYLDATYSVTGHGALADGAAALIPATDESGTIICNCQVLGGGGSDTYNYLISARYDTGGDRYYLHYNSTTYEFNIGFGGSYTLASGYTIPLNTPQSLVISWSPNSPKAYANGMLQRSFSQTGVGYRPTKLGVGRLGHSDINNYYSSAYFYGLIIFGAELNASQIAQLHETPYALLQPNPTPLIFDWGTASTVPTLSAPSFVGRIPSTTLAF